ncbi:cell division septation protein DedD [Paraburkholderia sp. WSM4177]|nr:cell division septation protein DedD [Paraburkholderia sp. WSM4177]MBB5485754.1 cell division septation protein DedD [Paraburkholderia sp. WSM4180]
MNGRFFNGQTYIGEYLVPESGSADRVRVSPVAIKLKVEEEKNLLQYT